jgi:hypothetical protein
MDTSTIQAMVGFSLMIALAAMMAIPFWKICDRTGLSKYLVLLIFIPLIGWSVPWIIALSDWPKYAKSAPNEGPQKGVSYTPSELEDFKRRG